MNNSIYCQNCGKDMAMSYAYIGSKDEKIFYCKTCKKFYQIRYCLVEVHDEGINHSIAKHWEIENLEYMKQEDKAAERIGVYFND